MDKDIPFWLSLVFVTGGLAFLVYSSDLFISAASKVAKKLGISPFITPGIEEYLRITVGTAQQMAQLKAAFPKE